MSDQLCPIAPGHTDGRDICWQNSIYTAPPKSNKWPPKRGILVVVDTQVDIIYELSNIMRKIHIYTPQPQNKGPPGSLNNQV